MGIFLLIGIGVALLVLGTSGVLVYRMLYPARKTFAYAIANGLLTNPGELGLNYQEQSFRLSDGTDTQGWVIEGKNQQGPVVVMTHGWESCIYNSLVRVPLIVKHASQLVLYDMRGHGESTAGISQLGTEEAHDILALIEQAVDGHTDVVLFGSSMGAGVSIVAAAKSVTDSKNDREGVRIIGVIAEAPYQHGIEPVYGHFRQQGWPGFPVVPLAYLFLTIWLPQLRRFDRVMYAAELACPLLVLHGTDDPISRFESGRRIVDAASSGHLVEFAGGTHGDLAEANPGKYIGALAEFFVGISNPPQGQDNING